MCHYTHLTPFEREKILFFLAEGKSITEIAPLLKRSKSTISRELRRNAAPVDQPMPYCPLTAQALYKQRREACHPHKRLEHAPLHFYIQICILEYHWSPEEIVGRIQLEHGYRLVSVPTIYRAIHAGLAELARNFSEVRTSETTASRETASQERQRRTSWQVRHIAPHRRASCQCSEPFRPWPLGSGYCGGQARKGMDLLRKFFPKGKDITDTPEDYIQRKYHELNLRPRKCLGYKTPYEVYFSKVLHLA